MQMTAREYKQLGELLKRVEKALKNE
jgi:hypothetical protein